MAEENKMSYYWVMDGRANYDIDKASVLVTTKTFEEAMEYLDSYGADTCIVEVTGQGNSVVHSRLFEEAAKSIVISVNSCARCQKDHSDLRFFEFIIPIKCGEETMTHHGRCPNTKEPILLRIEVSDTEIPKA